MVDSSFPLYLNNVPFEYPQIVTGKWDSGANLDIDFEPYTAHILFVRKITFVMTDDFVVSAGDFTIAHSSATGSNEYFTVTIDEEQDLLAICDNLRMFEIATNTNHVHGEINFDPPMKVRQSLTEKVQIAEATALTLVGTIWFTMHGWSMTEQEYDEVLS